MTVRTSPLPSRSLNLAPTSRSVRSAYALLTPAVLLLSALTTPAQDEARAIRQFKHPFRSSLKDTEGNFKAAAEQTAIVRQRSEVVPLLNDYDSVEVVKALVQAFTQVEQEVQDIDARRLEIDSILEKTHDRYYDKKEGKLKFTGGDAQAQMARWKALRQESGDLRTTLDEIRRLLFDLNSRIGAVENVDTLAWMLKNITGAKKYSPGLKVTVARAVGKGGTPMVEDMVAALARSKRTDETIALLDGIGLIGKGAKAAAPTIIKLLQHDKEAVKERAALALSTIAVPEAIEPMINLLATVHGQAKRRVAAYLEALTRQQFGENVATWRNWFKQEGADYLAGKHELGGGAPSHRKATTEKNYYFGIPQEGKAIVYIIDSSGSMKQEIDANLVRRAAKDDDDGKGTKASKPKPDKEKDKDGRGHKSTRLEACKNELIRALGLLSPKTEFNIIWFSDAAHPYKKALFKATPANVKAAQDWVRKLTPNSSTNIHDTLQLAFTFKNFGKKKRRIDTKKPQKNNQPNKYDVAYTEFAFDTIFLLTDGSPTKPPGDKPDSTEKILEGVRLWNQLQQVTIHCIGIGQGVNVPFMQQLASENRGQFKHFLD